MPRLIDRLHFPAPCGTYQKAHLKMTSTKPFLSSGSDIQSVERELKILHVAECYEAGVGHAVDTIVRILEKDTHVLLYSGDLNPSIHFSQSRRFRASFLARILDVRAAVREHNPDIVHLHSSWAGVYGRTARLRTPIIYQPHCFKFDDPALPKLKKYLFWNAEKLLGKLTKVVLALSPHESRLARGILPSASCVMLPNAPTVGRLDGPRQDAVLRTKKVIMVGRISPQKDPAFYIETAAIVRESIPQAEFVWAGGGDDSLTAELRNAGISVTGWLDSSALIPLLDSASCYVHTATYEGFPLSILDAAARKMPIVARQIPAFEGTELLQGANSAEVARHVVNILNDSRAANEASQRGQLVLDEMNEGKQRQALGKAYKIAMGETR